MDSNVDKAACHGQCNVDKSEYYGSYKNKNLPHTVTASLIFFESQ